MAIGMLKKIDSKRIVSLQYFGDPCYVRHLRNETIVKFRMPFCEEATVQLWNHYTGDKCVESDHDTCADMLHSRASARARLWD